VAVSAGRLCSRPRFFFLLLFVFRTRGAAQQRVVGWLDSQLGLVGPRCQREEAETASLYRETPHDRSYRARALSLKSLSFFPFTPSFYLFLIDVMMTCKHSQMFFWSGQARHETVLYSTEREGEQSPLPVFRIIQWSGKSSNASKGLC
jgi:hypothetical protein